MLFRSYGRSSVAQGQESMGWLLPQRDRLPRPRRQPCFGLGDVGERLVPAPFECPCHQAVVRLHAVIWTWRPLGLVARFLSRQRQCLAGAVVCGAHALECLPGCGNPSGLDGIQDGGCDCPIDAEAAKRQPGGGATIDAPPMTDRARHPPRGAALGHRELPAAAATAYQATAQRRAPFGGPPRPHPAAGGAGSPGAVAGAETPPS